MTRQEMDKLKVGDKVEVMKYNGGDYEWISTTVTNVYTADGGFTHGGRYSVWAKVDGYLVPLDPDFTRKII